MLEDRSGTLRIFLMMTLPGEDKVHRITLTTVQGVSLTWAKSFAESWANVNPKIPAEASWKPDAFTEHWKL